MIKFFNTQNQLVGQFDSDCSKEMINRKVAIGLKKFSAARAEIMSTQKFWIVISLHQDDAPHATDEVGTSMLYPSREAAEQSVTDSAHEDWVKESNDFEADETHPEPDPVSFQAAAEYLLERGEMVCVRELEVAS